MLIDLGTQKKVQITDQADRTAQISAFGILKTANEAILKEYTFDISSVSFNFDIDELPSGSLGNWEIVDSTLKINTGASSNSGIQLTTKNTHEYSVGRGLITKISIILGDSGVDGNVREWGMFDDNNGVFIRLNGTQYEFVLRNKGVDTVVPASNWDTSVTPDSYGHLWYIQYQWLGVGNFFIYYDEELVYTHHFIGTSTEASMAVSDLKVRYVNKNTTNSSDIYLKTNACSVSQEGLDKVRLASGDYEVQVSPEGELLVRKTSQILLDEHFNLDFLNTDKWVENILGSGSVIVDESMCQLNTTTANGDSAEIYSTQNFIHIFSQTYSFRCGIVLDDSNLSDNTKIWGMRNPTTNDGWYFRLNNGVLEACTEHEGTITAINIDAYKSTDGYVHRYDAIYRNYRVLFYIDQKLVYGASAVSDHLYGNEDLKLYFRNYNTDITTASILKIEGIALFDDTSACVQIAGMDDNGLIQTVAVSPTRRILVSQELPAPPPETTQVIKTEYSLLARQDDNIYVIPNGETLTIQRLTGGADGTGDGSVIELWYDPNGDGTNMIEIDILFFDGSSNQHDLSDEYIGNGTRAIRMRRKPLGGGGSRNIFGRWEGYY